MNNAPAVPSRVPLSADAELRVTPLEDPVQRGQLVADVRIWRRSLADRSGAAAYCATAAGFRVGWHLIPLLVDALQRALEKGDAEQ
jgi:hypothetical protein